MKYGVIVCPKCKKVKAVNLRFDTTRCFFCNKVITLKRVKIIFMSNNQLEISKEIGNINAELMK
jgi:hypothetical protein